VGRAVGAPYFFALGGAGRLGAVLGGAGPVVGLLWRWACGWPVVALGLLWR